MHTSEFSVMTFPFLPERVFGWISRKKLVSLIAKYGFPAVDLMDLSEGSAKRYKKLLTERGMKTNCYIASVSVLGKENAVKARLNKQMAIARLLGARYFMLVPAGYSKCAEQTWREKLLFAFSHCVQCAEGLTVCFETTPNAKSLLSSASDCRDILERVQGLKYVFDTANMRPAGEEPLSHYEALKEYVAYAHIKDVKLQRKGEKAPAFTGAEYTAAGERMVCVPYGEGVTPVKEMVSRLKADGYTGLFALEYSRPLGLLHGEKGHEAHLKKYIRGLENL